MNLPEPRGKCAYPPDEEVFRRCVWVKPVVNYLVDFKERSRDGRLRHAEFRELLPPAA